jgi:hypothetical protein
MNKNKIAVMLKIAETRVKIVSKKTIFGYINKNITIENQLIMVFQF